MTALQTRTEGSLRPIGIAAKAALIVVLLSALVVVSAVMTQAQHGDRPGSIPADHQSHRFDHPPQTAFSSSIHAAGNYAVRGTGFGGWDPRFFAPESPRIYAVFLDEAAALLVSGPFTAIGPVVAVANGFAVWDGSRWHGPQRHVRVVARAFATHPNGDVYAIGSIRPPGSHRWHPLARWNGRTWTTWDSFPDIELNSLVITPTGEMFTGGGIRAVFGSIGGVQTIGTGVRHYNGNRWETLPGEPYAIYRLAGSPSGRVVAAALGRATPSGNIYEWAPHTRTWSRYPDLAFTWFSPAIRLIFDADDRLYVSGRLRLESAPESALDSRLVRWDGKAWTDLSDRMVHGGPITMGPTGSVYVTGIRNGRIVINRSTDGEYWSVVDSSLTGRLDDVQVDPQGRIVAAGNFSGPYGVSNLGIFHNGAWHSTIAHGRGVDGIINSMLTLDDGSLYVRGEFAQIGSVHNSEQARWDGEKWTDPEFGIEGAHIIRHVFRGKDGRLYAAGEFDVGGADYHLVVKEGGSWAPVIPSFETTGIAWPHGFVSQYSVDQNGDVYLAGQFLAIDGIEVNKIARWDGEQFHPLGTGLKPSGTFIHTMVSDASGNLWVGGGFDEIGGVTSNSIARWDGERWHPLGTGVHVSWPPYSGSVHHIHIHEGRVYAAGHFERAGNTQASNIAVWDGSEWSSLGDGFDNIVMSVVRTSDAYIIAGGRFTWSGMTRVDGLAVWDGERWYPLGSGVQGLNLVRTMALGADGTLYVGGDFYQAGDTPSANIARWIGSFDFVDPSAQRPDVLAVFDLYPNPVSGEGWLVLAALEDRTVQIGLYDVLGRRVSDLYHGRLSVGIEFGVRFSTASLPSGVYFARVEYDGGASTRRLVVVR